MKIIKDVPVNKASAALNKMSNVVAIAIDGKTSSALMDEAQKKGVKVIAAKNFVNPETQGVELISF